MGDTGKEARPRTLASIGWAFPLGAVLMVIGIVLLVLVDVPRRAVWHFRQWRAASSSAASSASPGTQDSAPADSPSVWVETSPTPTPPDRPPSPGAGPDEREPPEADPPAR